MRGTQHSEFDFPEQQDVQSKTPLHQSNKKVEIIVDLKSSLDQEQVMRNSGDGFAFDENLRNEL